MVFLSLSKIQDLAARVEEEMSEKEFDKKRYSSAEMRRKEAISLGAVGGEARLWGKMEMK